MLYIEYSHAVLHFFKYSLADEYLMKAKKIIGIEFNFTGKLGVRTKYQSFKVSQLTLELTKNNEVDMNSPPLEVEAPQNDFLPKNIKLEDIIDNILLERPVIDDEEVKREISIYDHILILGLVRHMQKSSPFDDAQREYVLAYIHQNTDKFRNWSVYVMNLIVRSLTEFEFMKKRERSLLQLHQISDDWNQGRDDAYDRQKYIFALNFPSYIEFQTIIIDKYLSMGMVMTACQIYEGLNMLEECVECYFRANHLDKAKELAEQLVQDKPSAKLYCILGDIYKDEAMYLKAWEVSKHRSARAQRSLAKYWYNKQNAPKTIEHLQLALELNDYHKDSWTMLGFIYMNMKRNEEAIRCYSRVVQIDPQEGVAWANLANLFLLVIALLEGGQNQRGSLYNRASRDAEPQQMEGLGQLRPNRLRQQEYEEVRQSCFQNYRARQSKTT
jgi:tetratricopeptide (TPR) repeat protein